MFNYGTSWRRESMDSLSLSFLLVLATIIAMILISTLHQIPEGHVGVYWRGGALQKIITEPGFNFKMPLITQYEHVQVTLQTYEVTNTPCDTKGGIKISFEKIQVVYLLHKEYVYETLLIYGVHYDKTWIHDKIHHHIIQFCASHSFQEVYIDKFIEISEKIKEALQVDCSRYAPGIEIIGVDVTKPAIPDSIHRNFEQLEEERIKVLIASEGLKVAEKEAETLKKMAISEAEKNAEVSKIFMEQTLLEKEASRLQQEIENQMFVEHARCQADAYFYWATKEAEANRLKLTPEYLELKYIEVSGELANRTSGNNVFLSWLLQCFLARFVFGRVQNMILPWLLRCFLARFVFGRVQNMIL